MSTLGLGLVTLSIAAFFVGVTGFFVWHAIGSLRERLWYEAIALTITAFFVAGISCIILDALIASAMSLDHVIR